MLATHYFVSNTGHTIFCTPISRNYIKVLCDDRKTWMKEPLYINHYIIHEIKYAITKEGRE
jgi:hypothetical protein